ncbi:MAG: hypothetical protein SOZ59_09585 [Candidatus Limivivens sp.]|nr:hypothetical protein [Candidatus Limivivens sp.]
MKMYREEKKFAYIPMAISIFDVNGISSNYNAGRQERVGILEEMPVRDEEAIQKLKKDIRRCNEKELFYKFFSSKLIPRKFREMRRERMRKAAGWVTKEEFLEEKAKNGGRVSRPL